MQRRPSIGAAGGPPGLRHAEAYAANTTAATLAQGPWPVIFLFACPSNISIFGSSCEVMLSACTDPGRVCLLWLLGLFTCNVDGTTSSTARQLAMRSD